MNEKYAEGNFYTINHIVMFSGLSDRTIRNYISMGLLKGEKINGLWHFTPEQTEAFLTHPSVRPSILAKNNAIVYDFLLNDKKAAHEGCIILDFPDDDPKKLSAFFCYTISNGGYSNINFSFDCIKKSVPRVILSGYTEDILKLVTEYYKQRNN